MRNVVQKRVEKPDTDAGIFYVVGLMTFRAKRDSKFRPVVELARSLKMQRELDTMENCYNYVWQNIVYMKDSEAAAILQKNGFDSIVNPKKTELLNSPRYTLFGEIPLDGKIYKWKYGDCDCMSMALASLWLANDVRVNYKIIAHDTEDFSHVYLEGLSKDLGGWMPADPVLKEKGFGSEKSDIIRKRIFPIN